MFFSCSTRSLSVTASGRPAGVTLPGVAGTAMAGNTKRAWSSDWPGTSIRAGLKLTLLSIAVQGDGDLVTAVLAASQMPVLGGGGGNSAVVTGGSAGVMATGGPGGSVSATDAGGGRGS